MKEEKIYFAPAIRSKPNEIRAEYELVGSQKFFHEVFGAFRTKVRTMELEPIVFGY